MNLTARQLETLRELDYANHGSSYPKKWCTPLDLGASNDSHHSHTLAALAAKGLVQFKQRGAEDPLDGENGKRVWGARGSKCYRVTPAGRERARNG